MLRPIRYIAIIFAIFCQMVLAILAGGTLARNALPDGQYRTVNICVALSAGITTAFMCLISLTELAQKSKTTTTALFEVLWVLTVWVITTVEASYLSTARIAGCDQEYYMVEEGSWDICMVHGAIVPVAWAAAFFVTTHLVILVILIEWHRMKAFATAAIPPPSPEAHQTALRRFWTQTLKPELHILISILGKSVYVLIQQQNESDLQAERQSSIRTDLDAPRTKRFTQRISEAFSWNGKPRYPGAGFDMDERAHLRWQDASDAPPENCSWTGSYYFQVQHPNASQTSLLDPPTPIFTPSARLADLPRYQLRDEPAYRSSPLNDGSSAPKRNPAQPPRPPHIVVQSPTTTQSSRSRPPRSPSLPASPRSPHSRSNTLPTSVPQRAQLVGLHRARTLGSRRNPIPSRYRDMDLTVRDSRVEAGPPRPPPGFLPNPGGRYLT